MNYFPQNILYLRKKRKLRQDEMQQQCGIARGTWSNYENGITEPNIEALITIAKFFGVGITELLTVNLEKTHLIGQNTDSNFIGKNTPNDTPIPTPNDREDENRAEFIELLKKYNQVLEGKLIENEFRYKFEDVQATLRALQELILEGDLNNLTGYDEKRVALGKKKHEALVELGIVSVDSR